MLSRSRHPHAACTGVDGKEWCDRFGAAIQRLSGEGLLMDAADESADLSVHHSQLTPRCLEAGRWPGADEWTVSDHGVVTSRFVLKHAP